MARNKNTRPRRGRDRAQASVKTAPVHMGGKWHAARETIESIVIAFVLAFLFRTFEAEAFVIPTGSMSPSLQGQHKDVDCSACGYRFRTTASTEGEEREKRIAQLRNPALRPAQRRELRNQIAGLEVVAGMCPMCRQTIAFRSDLPPSVPSFVDTRSVTGAPSYPGDRILVNKYGYFKKDPERWDVIVFKYPGNGEMNYIKRLVGLPQETLRVYQGDIFIRSDSEEAGEFWIARKPAEKVSVMLQEVHDTAHTPQTLYDAGWPLRWQAESPVGWQVEAEPEGLTVKQEFRTDGKAPDDQIAWLRYRHTVPGEKDWTVARQFAKSGKYPGTSKEEWLGNVRPHLIRDFNPYNARRERRDVKREGWNMPANRLGLHWVSDLALECEVEVDQAKGRLLLDLVEAGKHFTCTIDLSNGEATVEGAGVTGEAASAETPISSAGTYRILFANVDDQLLLWVDGELTHFDQDQPTLLYDADEVFGGRENCIPTTSQDDAGDLAPAGVGAQNTSLTVKRLKVLRDIYYVATSWRNQNQHSDYSWGRINRDGIELDPVRDLNELFVDPQQWPRFLTRQKQNFPIDKDQLFVMGDNSPESLDCRLWTTPRKGDLSHPGGPYLDRRLLTGKAVCVFWPHSWGSIPGLNKLPGFPNFKDMRIVR